jgi:uridine kinase
MKQKQTAVEWLVEQFNTTINYTLEEYEKKVEQAKEMEIKQSHDYAEFAIRCDRKNMKILNFDGYMNLETFKSE